MPKRLIPLEGAGYVHISRRRNLTTQNKIQVSALPIVPHGTVALAAGLIDNAIPTWRTSSGQFECTDVLIDASNNMFMPSLSYLECNWIKDPVTHGDVFFVWGNGTKVKSPSGNTYMDLDDDGSQWTQYGGPIFAINSAGATLTGGTGHELFVDVDGYGGTKFGMNAGVSTQKLFWYADKWSYSAHYYLAKLRGVEEASPEDYLGMQFYDSTANHYRSVRLDVDDGISLYGAAAGALTWNINREGLMTWTDKASLATDAEGINLNPSADGTKRLDLGITGTSWGAIYGSVSGLIQLDMPSGGAASTQYLQNTGAFYLKSTNVTYSQLSISPLDVHLTSTTPNADMGILKESYGFEVQGSQSNRVWMHGPDSYFSLVVGAGAYLKLGDAAGAHKFYLKDSADVNILSIDSDGNISGGAITGSGNNSFSGQIGIVSGYIGLVVGANSNSYVRTNLTEHVGKVGGWHYDNTEEPVGIFLSDSYLNNNLVRIGGGSGSFNTATKVQIYAAATSTTLTGTQIAAFTIVGMSTAYPITSTLVVGTAPLAVTSTTVCTNLNADTVDAYHANSTPTSGQLIVGSNATGTFLSSDVPPKLVTVTAGRIDSIV